MIHLQHTSQFNYCGVLIVFQVTIYNKSSKCLSFAPMSSGFNGLVVSMLASGTTIRGFKPGEKILSMPSYGGEVKPSVPCRRFAACKRSLHLPCKSHAVGKIGSAISRPYFPHSLIEVFHVAGRGASLEMTRETKSGAQRTRS
jgi:hypothetical protein